MKNLVAFTLAIIAVIACNDKPEFLPPQDPLVVYPNPFFNHATISIQNPEANTFHLVVFDSKGRILLEKRESLEEASYTISNEEPKGTYKIILEIDGKTFTRTLIKLR